MSDSFEVKTAKELQNIKGGQEKFDYVREKILNALKMNEELTPFERIYSKQFLHLPMLIGECNRAYRTRAKYKVEFALIRSVAIKIHQKRSASTDPQNHQKHTFNQDERNEVNEKGYTRDGRPRSDTKRMRLNLGKVATEYAEQTGHNAKQNHLKILKYCAKAVMDFCREQEIVYSPERTPRWVRENLVQAKDEYTKFIEAGGKGDDL